MDTRSITEVRATDLVRYVQCHFFAGIGGWPLALKLAGWPEDRPVWTGSCPCQPFSSAARGRGKRLSCKRHLWPEWKRLIIASRPQVFFGEQVGRARDWLDVLCDEVEACNYSVWPCVLPAYSVGKDHERERIYFACHADSNSQPGVPINEKVDWMPGLESDSADMVLPDGFPSSVAYRGFGNAIIPELAASFIQAFLEATA